MDWGLSIHTGGGHSLLRPTLLYPRPVFYYGAMAANLALRLGWSLQLSPHIQVSYTMLCAGGRSRVRCLPTPPFWAWTDARLGQNHGVRV
jgi:hypothetical protein